MNQILTWTEFLAKIKREGRVPNADLDTFLLECANDVLQEICANAEADHRELRIDQEYAVLANTHADITGIFLHEILQLFYVKYVGGIPNTRWQLHDVLDVVYPQQDATRPNSYSLQNTTAAAAAIAYRLKFYPIQLGNVADKIQVIGTGFKHITDGTTLMPYVSFYPMILRSVLQRLQIFRAKDADAMQLIEGSIARARTYIPRTRNEPTRTT